MGQLEPHLHSSVLQLPTPAFCLLSPGFWILDSGFWISPHCPKMSAGGKNPPIGNGVVHSVEPIEAMMSSSNGTDTTRSKVMTATSVAWHVECFEQYYES
jgi:hypothetical protein